MHGKVSKNGSHSRIKEELFKLKKGRMDILHLSLQKYNLSFSFSKSLGEWKPEYNYVNGCPYSLRHQNNPHQNIKIKFAPSEISNVGKELTQYLKERCSQKAH